MKTDSSRTHMLMLSFSVCLIYNTHILRAPFCIVSGKLMLTDINLTIGVMNVKPSH